MIFWHHATRCEMTICFHHQITQINTANSSTGAGPSESVKAPKSLQQQQILQMVIGTRFLLGILLGPQLQPPTGKV